MQQRIAAMEQQLSSAAVMHDQISGLMDQGIIKQDANLNIELNTDNDNLG